MKTYWAEIDDKNIVLQVLVLEYIENQAEWLNVNVGGTWIQTFDDSSQRFNFASVGYLYDPIDDAFIAPVPCAHEELILNDKKQWQCTNGAHDVIS